MSGVMNGAVLAPLIAAGDAGKLLDEIIYERVLNCIDVDALLTFECEMQCALDVCGLERDEHGRDLAKDMIERALNRARDERWEVHLRTGHTYPFEPWDADEREDARDAPHTEGVSEPAGRAEPFGPKRGPRKARSS